MRGVRRLRPAWAAQPLQRLEMQGDSGKEVAQVTYVSIDRIVATNWQPFFVAND